jgi:hypothetical protein
LDDAASVSSVTSKALSLAYNVSEQCGTMRPGARGSWIASLFTLVSRVAAEAGGGPRATPAFGHLQYAMVAKGLAKDCLWDVWGEAKNTLLYVRTYTLRVTANGYAVLMNRRNLQLGIAEFVRIYQELVDKFANLDDDDSCCCCGCLKSCCCSRALYPANMPLEIRVTGLDAPEGLHMHNGGYDEDGAVVAEDPPVIGVTGSRPTVAPAPAAAPANIPAGPFVSPAVSAMHVDADCAKYGYDVALWLDVLSLPDTPGAAPFYAEMEAAVLASPVFGNPKLAKVRPEWSKGWGYTPDRGAWTSESFLQHAHAALPQWNGAVQAWNDMDPTRVFGNPDLDRITS